MSRWLPQYSSPAPARGYGLPRLYSINRYNAVRANQLQTVGFRGAPYGSPAGSPAHLTISVLSATPADYDGFGFLLDYPLGTTETATAQQGWTFDDDAAPPSTASVIKIQGLTSVFDIATQIALAINLAAPGMSRPNAFKAYVSAGDPSKVIVLSLPGGSRANLLATVPDDFNDVLQFNDVTDFNAAIPYFFGGSDLSIPARFGMNYAMLPNIVSSPSVPIPT